MRGTSTGLIVAGCLLILLGVIQGVWAQQAPPDFEYRWVSRAPAALFVLLSFSLHLGVACLWIGGRMRRDLRKRQASTEARGVAKNRA